VGGRTARNAEGCRKSACLAGCPGPRRARLPSSISASAPRISLGLCRAERLHLLLLPQSRREKRESLKDAADTMGLPGAKDSANGTSACWRRSSRENQEFAAQRLGRTSITRGNVGSSRTAGNQIGKTVLAGWGGRIRTLGSREAAFRAGLDRNGGAIGTPYSLQNGLDWGASHSLAAQPGIVSDR
jgi:hypothetical protein